MTPDQFRIYINKTVVASNENEVQIVLYTQAARVESDERDCVLFPEEQGILIMSRAFAKNFAEAILKNLNQEKESKKETKENT